MANKEKAKIKGAVSHETEANVPASEAWELYGTCKLVKLVEDEFKSLIEKIEIVEGDGGLGTVLNLHFTPGTPGSSNYKEKFTKVDDEKRVKEAEVVEGGYLDMGFTFYRVRFEVFEKDDSSCTIKTTIEYELKEEAAANASAVSIEQFAQIAELAKSYFIKNKA